MSFTDPTGLYLINNVARGAPSATTYVQSHSVLSIGPNILNEHGQQQIIQTRHSALLPDSNKGIELPNGLDGALQTSHSYQTDKSGNTESQIAVSATQMADGKYEISLTVTNTVVSPDGTILTTTVSGVVAYASKAEVCDMMTGEISNAMIEAIANEVVNIDNGPVGTTDNNVEAEDDE